MINYLAVDQETYLKSKDHLLVSAYKRSLEIAKELEVKNIGFTLLSAGMLDKATSAFVCLRL